MKATGTSACRALLAAALILGAGGAAAASDPQALPTAGDSFAAPYDAVWDAVLRNLGVVKLLVADKATGRIETEAFPYTFPVSRRPGFSPEAVRLAAVGAARARLAQEGGGDTRAMQVIWIAMRITVTRGGERLTHVQVEPFLHNQILQGFTPGPTNSPWGDLFAKVRSHLGLR